MPRTYVRKTLPKYSAHDLESARKEVENGSSVYAAAKKFGIPYETLRRWHENPPSHQGAGRGTVLSKEEEKYIVTALQYVAKCGYPMDRQDLKYMISSYVKSVGRKTPFKDNLPGYDFLVGFEERWKDELKLRKPDLLTKARAEALSPYVVEEFFKLYEQVLDENDLRGHPARIFNLDETGLGTDPTKGKVFVPKSAKVSYSRSGGAGKLQYSVLFVASADGEKYPPFVVFKGTGALQSTWVQNGPPNALYGVSESGWMQDYIFEKWLIAFVKQVNKIPKPILLLFDGHGSHLTYNVTCVARQNNIILLCLPPNTSHALQPMDVGVFGPMKQAWRDILKTWYRESRLKNVDKAVFPSLLNKLIMSSFKREHIISGFKGSGIYPVSKASIANKIVTVSEIENQPNHTLPNKKEPAQTTANANPNDEPRTFDDSLGLPNLPGPSSAITSRPIPVDVVNPSPMKKLREAIINTLSPEQSADVKAALKNSKTKRRRVQNSIGEVLTTEEVMNRLKEEEEARKRKRIGPKKNVRPTTAVSERSTSRPTEKAQIRGKRVSKMLDFEVDDSDDEVLNTDNLGLLEKKIVTGSWVAVNYQSECGSVVKEYRGQVTSQDARNKERFSVKFLTKCKGEGHNYIFPEKDDIEWVDVGQISQVFPVPIFNGRYYKFVKQESHVTG